MPESFTGSWHIPVGTGVMLCSQPLPLLLFPPCMWEYEFCFKLLILFCGVQIYCWSGKHYEVRLQLEEVVMDQDEPDGMHSNFS